jgi:hypothetical protein
MNIFMSKLLVYAPNLKIYEIIKFFSSHEESEEKCFPSNHETTQIEGF